MFCYNDKALKNDLKRYLKIAPKPFCEFMVSDTFICILVLCNVTLVFFDLIFFNFCRLKITLALVNDERSERK